MIHPDLPPPSLTPGHPYQTDLQIALEIAGPLFNEALDRLMTSVWNETPPMGVKEIGNDSVLFMFDIVS